MIKRIRRFGCLALLLLAAGAGHVLWTLPSLTQLDTVANHLEIVFTKRGETIEFKQAIFNLKIDLDEMPGHLRDALLTMEDRRFRDHWGVDYRGVTRAVLSALRDGQPDSGGSTITQQLAKNMFLSPERTVWRKLKEVLLALKLEAYYSKDEILQMYLNSIYFGKGANGIESASRRFFAKRARDLNLWESALLIGSVPSPENWNVLADEKAAEARAELVLEQMRLLGKLPGSEQVAHRIERGDRQWHRADYVALLEAMRPEILEHARGRDGDLVVITTIDPELQVYAELAARRGLETASGQNVTEAALVALGRDAGIRAMVGSADRSKSTVNHVTQTRRQLGSVIKPVVYLAALENGWKPDDTVSGKPLEIEGWEPRNPGGEYPDSISLTEALVESQNTATVRLMEKVGRSRVIELAQRLGLDARLPDNPGLALGVGEGSLLSVAGVYHVLASGGEKRAPFLVWGIRDLRGNILYWRQAEPGRRAASLEHTGALNAMLAEAVYRGTGKNAAIPTHRVAGKTGTTQDNRDAWFVGFSAHLTAAVWVGNDDNSPMDGVAGSNVPALIWRNFMANAHESDKLEAEPLPGGVR